MTQIWENLTIAQALIGLGVLWIVVTLGEKGNAFIRERRGLSAYMDHCEHCDLVTQLSDTLTHAADLDDAGERVAAAPGKA